MLIGEQLRGQTSDGIFGDQLYVGAHLRRAAGIHNHSL
jgi:hypothetical protein